MKINRLEFIIIFFLLIVTVTLTDFFRKSPELTPDKADQQMKIDFQVAYPVDEQIDQSNKSPEVFMPLANLQDIQQANSANFYLKHNLN